MQSSLNTNRRHSIVLFLIWPFFALVYAIRNYKAVWAKDIIWLFVVFYGMTFTIHNTAEETIDANRYKDKFEAMAASEITFETISANFYNAEEQNLDILETIIIFTLSRVTGNFHVLFSVFGLIYGYFYSRNIWYLIDRTGKKITPVNIPVILTFAFIVGFWQINGFRFWTATHMFLYGALPYLFEGRKKSLWFCFLACLMHFSYVLPLGIIGIYAVLGNRTTLFFVLFISTFFLKEFSISEISDFLTAHLPAILQPKVKTYTNEEVIAKQIEAFSRANWYVKVYNDALKWSVTAFLIVLYFRGHTFLRRNKSIDNLFCFSLLMYSAANVVALMPSGGRFLYLANLFAIAVIFLYVQFAPRGKAVRRVIFLSVPLLSLFSIVAVRVSFDTMGFFSVFGNPAMTIFLNVDITLIEMIKALVL